MSSDWRQNKTQQVAEPEGVPSGEELAPGLTLLAHPDADRVGERLPLSVLLLGREVRLSRLEPYLKQPGEDTGRPLEDSSISRQPLIFRPGPDEGVVLHRAMSQTLVEVNGESLSQEKNFSVDDLQRGVVLLVGRTVLLLHQLPLQPTEETFSSSRLLGESRGMVRLRGEIQRLAGLEVPVLLRGESGTGKELVARALHEAGPRRENPFVAVNMASIPPTLAAAELFGAKRGAYTGAAQKKVGFFQHAHGGTLFLDEIGETPTEVQPMLLRALETQEILPVGEVEPVRIHVRVITATDLQIENAIAEGRFRAPLLHRLAGYTVRLPTLASRRDDIGRLFYTFLREELRNVGAEARLSNPIAPWPPAATIAFLARYDWPGNVRELRNVARWMAITGRDLTPVDALAQLREVLTGSVDHSIPGTANIQPPSQTARPATRRKLRKPSEVGRQELLDALKKHRFEVKAAAAELGVSRTNLYRMIEESPDVRKAKDLQRNEIDEALKRCNGDTAAAAQELAVSLKGLKRRIAALGDF